MLKKILLALLVLLLAAILIMHFLVAPRIGAQMNATLKAPPYAVSAEAKALHEKLLVADLHADSLLWNRDLNQHSSYGHVDVPRLIAGNVALQSFTIVTKTPRNMNIESNADDSDQITLLAMAEFWPLRTWTNLTERTLHQAQQLHAYAAASQGRLTIIRTRADLESYLARRRNETGITAGFLGVEGAHALSGDPANLDRLYDAGIRMIGLAHFFDNEFAGSAHGVEKHGLTALGKQLVARMQEKQVFIDLAHCSARTIDDVLALATRPVIVSHSGVKGTCNNNRNLSDDQLRRIAATGGVVGIGFWDTAACGTDAQAIARAIRHAVNVMGIDHVALGSDYDGAVTEPFDISGIALITEALLKENFSADESRKIMGENVLRTLQAHLP